MDLVPDTLLPEAPHVKLAFGGKHYVPERVQLLKAGACCGKECQDCPYRPKHQKGATETDQGWVGFDLDDTLAEGVEGDFDPERIGDPNPEMVRILKLHLDAGDEVRIFTARAGEPENIPPIQGWLKKHGLPNLGVTDTKDPACRLIYDNIAVSVNGQTGQIKRAREMVRKPRIETHYDDHCPHCDHRFTEKGYPRPDFRDADEEERNRLFRSGDYDEKCPACGGIVDIPEMSDEEFERYHGPGSFLHSQREDALKRRETRRKRRAARAAAETTKQASVKLDRWSDEAIAHDNKAREMALRKAEKALEGEQLETVRKGHGKIVGSCGHTIQQCRCPHGAALRFEVDLPCWECVNETEKQARQLTNADIPTLRRDPARVREIEEFDSDVIGPRGSRKPQERQPVHSLGPDLGSLVGYATFQEFMNGDIHKEAVVNQDPDTGKWVLWTRDGTRRLGTHDTADAAYRQEYAIQRSQERRSEKGVVYHYTDRSLQDSIRERGLLSPQHILDDPELLVAVAKTRDRTPEEQAEHLRERIKERDAARGPNVMFAPPPDGMELADNHPMRTQDMVKIKVRLADFLRDKPDAKLHGLELTPYSADAKPEERHRELTPEEIEELMSRPPEELWKHYSDPENVGYYASDVPHAAVVSPDGKIPPEYLEFPEESEKRAAHTPEQRAKNYDRACRQTDTDPTEAQKESGNYRKGRFNWFGLRVSIENPAGSVRRGVSSDGKKWETKMVHTYGYVLGSEGRDGDHVDVFIGPNLESDQVFVVDQVNPGNGHFDEHKCMIGFDSLEEARKGYLDNYQKGWQGLGAITPCGRDEFIDWLRDGETDIRFSTQQTRRMKKVASAAGPDTIESRLAALDLDALEAEQKAILKKGAKTKRTRAVQVLRIIEGLRRNNVQPRDLMIRQVPVIPPQYRPFTVIGQSLQVGDANELYSDLLKFRSQYERARETFGPAGARKELATLREAVRSVYGQADPVNPKTLARGVSGFWKKIVGTTPKYSFVHRKLLSKPQDFVGRSVIIPDPDLDITQIGLPRSVAWPAYAIHVQRRLVKMGMSPADALRNVREKTDAANKALAHEVRERGVIYSRAPAWHKFNTIYGMPALVDGDAIRISPYVAAGMNADYDGDQINIHVPASREALEDGKTKLRPDKMVWSIKQPDRLMPMPKQEMVAGTWRASTEWSGKVHKFRSRQEAIAAIRAGQVNPDDDVDIPA